MNAFNFIKAECWKIIFNIPCIFRIKYEMFMLFETQLLFIDAQRWIPLPSILLYCFICFFVLIWADKKLSVSLLELACSEKEVTWRDFISEGLTHLSNSKWN